MAAYFTSTTLDAALATTNSPPDDENFESEIDPGSPAFAFLVELVFGVESDDLAADQIVQKLSPAPNGYTVSRLGSDLTRTIANLDEDQFQDLAEPWSAGEPYADVTTGAVDFLTDLQHLCRHAMAVGADVYASSSL